MKRPNARLIYLTLVKTRTDLLGDDDGDDVIDIDYMYLCFISKVNAVKQLFLTVNLTCQRV